MGSKLAPALQADIENRHSEAIKLYYEAIESGEASLDSLLDLSFLLWKYTSDRQQVNDILQKAGALFPESRMPLFWKIVFAWQDNGIILCKRDWTQIFRPLIHTHTTDTYAIPRMELLYHISKFPTAWNLYFRDEILPLLEVDPMDPGRKSIWKIPTFF